MQVYQRLTPGNPMAKTTVPSAGASDMCGLRPKQMTSTGSHYPALFFKTFAGNGDICELGLSAECADQWPGHSLQFNFDAATTDTLWARSRGPVARPLRFGAMARA